MQEQIISIANIMASNPGAAISSQSCSLMGEIKGQLFRDKATKK